MRTFGEPCRLVGVQNAVEDSQGTVDRLAVYNYDPTLKPQDILPKTGIFAIKEPYYKATADQGYTIRVDHPSDYINLRPGHPLIPAAFTPRLVEVGLSPIDLKTDGNAAYLAKDYITALDLYSRGIIACEVADGRPRRDLLRNRSIVNLLLMRYDAAGKDARTAIIPASEALDEDTTKRLNTKAWFRAGQAAYQYEDFQQAEQEFARAIEASPHDGDALRERERVVQRLREIQTGHYDFAQMRISNKKCLRLDHASYTQPVIKRNTEHRGRGLFATMDVKAGDLLLCEKALEVAFKSDNMTDIVTIINLNTNRGSMGPHATLMSRVISKAHHNPNYAARLLDLYDQGYTPKCAARQVDDRTVIDSFQVQSIIECNCFGCEDSKAVHHSKHDTPSGSVGIWVTASYINHDCIGNARRSFIGDMMIVRAVRDVVRDEEITMPYISYGASPSEHRKRLQRTWGFKCECLLCLAESGVAQPQRRDRQKLTELIGKFLVTRQQSETYHPDKATIRRAEELFTKLEGSYDKSVFGDLPRLGLVELNLWLCQAYAAPATAPQLLKAAIQLLRNAGFHVTSAGTVLFDRSSGMIEASAVDAAVYAAHANSALSRPYIAQQFNDLARGMYRTLHGDLHRFDSRYAGLA